MKAPIRLHDVQADLGLLYLHAHRNILNGAAQMILVLDSWYNRKASSNSSLNIQSDMPKQTMPQQAHNVETMLIQRQDIESMLF